MNPEELRESVINKEEKLEEKTLATREVGIPEIMSYYFPKWLAYLGILLSLLIASSFPLVGFFFAKVLFTYMIPLSSDRFYEQRNLWCSLILALAFISGFLIFIQTWTFGYLGENLTLTIRRVLF